MYYDLQKENLNSVTPEFQDGSSLPKSFISQKDQHFNKNQSYNHSLQVGQVTEEDFSKKFTFESREVSQLPSLDSLFKDGRWEVEELQLLKKELNNVKSLLNHYNLKEWHFHTRKTNHAGEVLQTIKRNINPEFLTQAWCKFYEIVSSYPLIPKTCEENKKFYSVHLCEAPGAFIASLNHFLKLNHPEVEWDWLASTLNPYYEGNSLSQMINDDRFLMHTIGHWCFGWDFTGNLHEMKNLSFLLQTAQKMGPISLVTADGSIDCQDDPGEQEHRVSPLHFSETVAALHLLSQGGSFVLKMFTLYECETISLMFLLCCIFESVNVFKPVTSKEGNSEAYVICLGYVGKENIQPFLKSLNNFFGWDSINEKALVAKHLIPENFFVEVQKCANFFTKLQMSVISRNIELYENGIIPRTRGFLFDLRRTIAETYISRYKLGPLLNGEQYIVGNDTLKESFIFNIERRDEQGTFEERKNFSNLEKTEYLLHLKKILENIQIIWEHQEVKWLSSNPLEGPTLDTVRGSLIFGTPIKEINSSKFCFGKLIDVRKQLERLRTNESCQISQNLFQTVGFHSEYGIQSPLHYCDVHNYFETLSTDEAQRKSFTEILDQMKRLTLGHSLFIIGFPLLSQFNVAVVYTLAHMFDNIGFYQPDITGYTILLYNYKDFSLMNILEEVNKQLYDSSVKTLIAFLPISFLCFNEEWYKLITTVNHITLKETSLRMIQNFLSCI